MSKNVGKKKKQKKDDKLPENTMIIAKSTGEKRKAYNVLSDDDEDVEDLTALPGPSTPRKVALGRKKLRVIPRSPYKVPETDKSEVKILRVTAFTKRGSNAPSKAMILLFGSEGGVEALEISVWDKFAKVRDSLQLGVPSKISRFNSKQKGSYDMFPVIELNGDTRIETIVNDLNELHQDFDGSIIKSLIEVSEVEDADSPPSVIVLGFVSQIFKIDGAASNMPKARVEIYDSEHRSFITVFEKSMVSSLKVGNFIICAATKKTYNGSLQLNARFLGSLSQNLFGNYEFLSIKRGRLLTLAEVSKLPTLSPPTRSLENSIKNPRDMAEFFSSVQIVCLQQYGDIISLVCPNCTNARNSLNPVSNEEGEIYAYKCSTHGIIATEDQLVVSTPLCKFEGPNSVEFKAKLGPTQAEVFFGVSEDDLSYGVTPHDFLHIPMTATVKISSAGNEVLDIKRN